MAAYDGSIRIDTKIDSKNFNSGIRAISQSLRGVATAIGVAFSVAAVVNFGKAAVDAASDITNAFIGLQSVVQGQGQDFGKAKQFIQDYIKDGLVPVTNAVTAYKNLALRGYSDKQIQQTLTALKDSAAFGRQASLTLGYAVQSATEGLKNENSVLTDNAGVTKNISKMWETYADRIGTTVDKLTQQQKIQAEVNGIVEESRFQAGDAAKLTKTYSGQVAALGVSFYNLKAAIGNAIVPLLTAIIPYVKAAIEALTTLFTFIAGVMSSLFGVQAQAAQAAGSATESAVKSQGDLAKSTEDATKAAKGQLAAWDELNVLQKNDNAGTETGGVTAPIVPVVSTDTALTEAEKQIEDFKNKLLDFLTPAIEAFGRLRDALAPLGQLIWEGLKWAWDNVLAPMAGWVIQDALPAFLDLVSAALKVLTAVLNALKPLGVWLWDNFLQPIAKWTGGAIIDILKWVVDRLTDLAKWINENQEKIQVLAVVIGALAVAFGAFQVVLWIVNAAMTAWTIITGLWAGASVVLLPILGAISPAVLAIAAGIAVVIGIIVLLVRNFDVIKETVINVVNAIIRTWNGIGPWFKTNVVDPVVRDFFVMLEDVKKYFSNLWNNITSKWEKLGEWFNTTVIDPIKNAFRPVLDWLGKAWDNTFGGVVGTVKNAINVVIDIINTMIRAIASGINVVIGALNGLRIDIPTWVPGIGGQTWGMNIPLMNAPQIPRLATGAVIPPNAAFAAILGDQRNGRNLEAPEGLIRQIIQEELGNLGDMTVTMPVYLDGRVIYENQKKIQRRIGGSLIRGGSMA